MKRWPIASGLFLIHAAFIGLIYVLWATSGSVERGMIWMTVFLVDLPSSYLFVDWPMTMHALSALLIGGLQWALVGAVLDLVRKAFIRRRSSRANSNV